MRIARLELFRLLGIELPSGAPLSLVMENEDGTRQVSIKWVDDEFSADLSECFAGDPSEVVLALEGTFQAEDDEFELKATDRDSFEPSEADAHRVASKFGRMSVDMQAI